MPMLSSTTNFRVLSLVWQLFVVLLTFVPAAWAATAMCEPGWEWVRSFRSFAVSPFLVDLATHHAVPCLWATDRQAIRRIRTRVKSLGTYKHHVWGIVSTRMAKCLSGTRLLSYLSAGTYELGPLKPGSVYIAPRKNDTKGLKCGCNTVIYRSVWLVLSLRLERV